MPILCICFMFKRTQNLKGLTFQTVLVLSTIIHGSTTSGYKDIGIRKSRCVANDNKTFCRKTNWLWRGSDVSKISATNWCL